MTRRGVGLSSFVSTTSEECRRLDNLLLTETEVSLEGGTTEPIGNVRNVNMANSVSPVCSSIIVLMLARRTSS